MEKYDKLLVNRRIKTCIKNIDELDEKDVKFYKKRIYDLTKQLLHGETPPIFLKDLTNVFNDYIRICIIYFKLLDRHDLNQEEYSSVEKSITLSEEPEINLDKELHRMFKFKNPSHMPNSLEKIVKRTTSAPTENPTPIFIPMQKEFNLSDPALRNKGICKKNNIPIIHEKEEKQTSKKENKGGDKEENTIIDEKFFINAMQTECGSK